MFGIKIGINAADNTAGALRKVEHRLKSFSRGVLSILSVGGLVMVASKIKNIFDFAFKSSGYEKEWGSFKDSLAQGWGKVLSRFADAVGPLLDTLKEWGETFFDYIDRAAKRTQWLYYYAKAVKEAYDDPAKEADRLMENFETKRKRKKAEADEARALEEWRENWKPPKFESEKPEKPEKEPEAPDWTDYNETEGMDAANEYADAARRYAMDPAYRKSLKAEARSKSKEERRFNRLLNRALKKEGMIAQGFHRKLTDRERAALEWNKNRNQEGGETPDQKLLREIRDRLKMP